LGTSKENNIITMENEDIIRGNIEIYLSNIEVLRNLRPKVDFNIEAPLETRKTVFNNNLENYLSCKNKLIALNSSLITNCFSLFESVLEWLLLENLSTKGLSSTQERVMNKYIDDIILISGIHKYKKEYTFITGKDIKERFSPDLKLTFEKIEMFYVVRHLLAHGSAMRNIYIPIDEFGGEIAVSKSDKKYQNFLNMIKNDLEINIPNEHFTLKTILVSNQITDLLIACCEKITNELRTGENFLYLKE